MLGPVDKTTVLALIVGVKDYADPRLESLSHAASDAQKIQTLLLQSGVPADNIRFYSTAPGQESPDSHNIWTTLIDDLATVDCQRLFVFWSGHGYWQGQRDRRVIFSDTTTRNQLNLDISGLVQYIRSSDCRARSALIIVDACGEYFKANYYRSFPEHEFPHANVAGTSGAKPVFTIFSAGHGQFSFGVDAADPRYPMSRFVAELLDACPDATSMDQPAEEVVRQLRIQFASRFGQQSPVFWAEDWDGRDLVTPAILITDSLYAANARPTAESILRKRTLAWQTTGESRHFLSWGEALKVSRWRLFRKRNLSAAERALYKKSLFKLFSTPVFALAVLSLLIGSAIIGWGIYQFIERVKGTSKVAEEIKKHHPVIRIGSTLFFPNGPQDDPLGQGIEARHTAASRQANGALALFQLGCEDALLQLLAGPEDPDEPYDPIARTMAIANALSPAGTDPKSLFELLDRPRLVPRTKQALILALGCDEVWLGKSSQLDPEIVRDRLLEIFENDHDPGVHAAALWCLLNQKKLWNAKTEQLLSDQFNKIRGIGVSRIKDAPHSRSWFVDPSTGLTMIVLLAEGRVSYQGDRDEQLEEGPYYPQEIVLPHSYLIAMTELSPDADKAWPNSEIYDFRTRPFLELSRDQAVEKCRLLTENSNLPSGTELEIAGENYLLGDYQLPTEIQWEYACRGGSLSAFCFGDRTGANHYMLGRYATLYSGVSNERNALMCRPNDFGLFDMHGGPAEWAREDFGFTYPPTSGLQEHAVGNDGTLRGGNGVRDQEVGSLKSFTRSKRRSNRDVAPAYGIGCRPVRELVRVKSLSNVTN